ncbi:MAG: hypothetical protein DMG89_06070 [Acidobacteria bacterium]|nr:MAG: hypothetical protein DMG89_06070 [Acidobacteriota bacterium]
MSIDAENERWRLLCEQAATEQDLGRRIELVREINRLLIEGLLEEKDRLNLIPRHRSPILRPER